MDILLTPELEKFIRDKIERGFYTSESEVICESLRFMRTYEDLYQAIEIGLSQANAGKTVSSKESYERIKKMIESTASKRNEH